MQIKAFFLATSMAFAIVAASYGLGLTFTNHSLMEVMELDLSLASEIADDLISTKIKLLKSDADTVAARLAPAKDAEELETIMREQLDDYPDFMGFAVFDRKSRLAFYGDVPTPEKRGDGRYIQEAFKGRSVISSTRYDEETGMLVLHICVPIDEDRVLSVTIPGMVFSDILSEYRLWETGNIFIIDENGVMIANFRRNLVLERANFVDEAKTDASMVSAGAFFTQMLSEPKGSGFYELYGVERFCVFRHISGSVSGWVLGVAAPLPESPATRIRSALFFSALALFAMGMVLAAVFSKNIARPFQQIAEQNHRLEELNEVAKRASQAKSALLANMSHEMRTPMSAIIGFSELALSDDADPNGMRPALKKIHKAGQMLLGIINDILDISKIESGKFELIPVGYDLPSIINDVMTLNLFRLGEKPIEFILDVDPNLPERVMGDELRVKQICNNLLSNALKYTKKGTVTWGLTSERGGGKDVYLVLTVRDTGIGIKEEDIGQLFSDYNQLDVKSNRAIEGTGLGLALAKRLVEMMDGQITVQSEYGQGTTFTARIRQGFLTDTPIGTGVAENLRSHAYIDNKRQVNAKLVRIAMPYAAVLVVDDNLSNLDIAKGMLKPYKMRVDCVSSGQEAIDLVAAGKPKYDAVFMDHMMPGMDGTEAMKRIRALATEYARNMPIIALTANAIVGNEEMFLANGFDAFLTKPIDTLRFDAALRKFVRNKALENETAPVAETPKTPTPLNIAGLDAEKLLARFGDVEACMEILASYGTNNGRVLAEIEGVTQDTLADYAIAVHGLKSSSQGICAFEAGQMAEQLEHAAKAGDWALVSKHHGAFMETAAALIANIDSAVAAWRSTREKPRQSAPDAALLEKLAAACDAFDIDAVDAALSELNQFDYETSAELVSWLKEQASVSGYKKMAARIRKVKNQ